MKSKVEQMTQRTWNVPVFDFFDLTSKQKDPPLEGFDMELDAYTRLKYNFEGVYSIMDNLATTTNAFVSQNIESPINQSMQSFNSGANNDDAVQNLNNLNTNIDLNGILPSTNKTADADTGTLDYATAYKTLHE